MTEDEIAKIIVDAAIEEEALAFELESRRLAVEQRVVVE
jgi:hypothetical protein